MDAQKRIDEAIRKANDVCDPANPCTAEDVWHLQNEIAGVRKVVKDSYDEELKDIETELNRVSEKRTHHLNWYYLDESKIAFWTALILLLAGLVYLINKYGEFHFGFFVVGIMLWPVIICFFFIRWLVDKVKDHFTLPGLSSFDKILAELRGKERRCNEQLQNTEAIFDGIKARLEAERRRRYECERRAENERRQALLLLQEQQKQEEARRKAAEAERRRKQLEEERRRQEEERRRQLEEERRRQEEEHRRQLEEDGRIFDEQVAACTEQMLEASEKPGALQDMVNQLTAEVKQAMKIGCEKTQAKWWFIFSVVIKDTALEYHIMMPCQKEKPKIKTITYERSASEYKKFGLCQGLITLMKFNPLVGENAEWDADVHDVCGAEALHKQRTVNNKGFTTTAVTSFKITYTGPNVNYEKPQSLY